VGEKMGEVCEESCCGKTEEADVIVYWLNWEVGGMRWEVRKTGEYEWNL
jgi:hypothetical protein